MIEHIEGSMFLCHFSTIEIVLRYASEFFINDLDCIRAASEDWFSGYSRISDGLKPEEVKYVNIEVE